MLTAANNELFPTFGKPISPTSANTLRIIFNSLSSPIFPLVVFLGALLVDVLNLALPNPNSPPFAISTDWPSFSKSHIISSLVLS